MLMLRCIKYILVMKKMFPWSWIAHSLNPDHVISVICPHKTSLMDALQTNVPSFLSISLFFAWRWLLVPFLLHHLILNSSCQKKLLLLPSSEEGWGIWSRVTEEPWWTVWACSLRSLRKSLCLCTLSAYLWCAWKRKLLLFGCTAPKTETCY